MSATAVAAGAPARRLALPGLLVLSLGALDFGLEQALIVPALPAMAAHYRATLSEVAWLATGFLLASIVAVPLLGRLGDLFGKRRVLLFAYAAFAAGSLVSALAGSIGLVIVGRIIQGAGAAFAPLTLGLLRDLAPPKRLPHRIGFVVGMAGAGAAVGVLLSGILVDDVSVPAIFWFLFGIGIVLVVGALAFVPESPVRKRVPIDLLGAAALGSGLAALLLAISKGNDWGWSSARILGLFAGSALLLAAFVAVERTVPQPLVDLRLVLARPFAVANFCGLVFGFAFYLAAYLIPQMAALPEASGYGLGLNTLQIGYILLPTGIASLVGAWVGGLHVDRIGPRLLVAAAGGLGIGAYASLLVSHDSAVSLGAASAVLGLAWGLVLTGLLPLIVRKSDPDKTSVAASMNVILRNTGTAVGTQVAFALLIGAGLVGHFPSENGFQRAFLMGLLGSVVVLVVGAVMPGRVDSAVEKPASQETAT
jgi:EmrB/QacA subfamily drug resistance transporter